MSEGGEATTRVVVERCPNCGQETRYLPGMQRRVRCQTCDAPLVRPDPRRQHEADPRGRHREDRRRQRPQ